MCWFNTFYIISLYKQQTFWVLFIKTIANSMMVFIVLSPPCCYGDGHISAIWEKDNIWHQNHHQPTSNPSQSANKLACKSDLLYSYLVICIIYTQIAFASQLHAETCLTVSLESLSSSFISFEHSNWSFFFSYNYLDWL